MGIFDDIFMEQANSQRTFQPFDKENWAAQKQQAREQAYTQIDQTAQALAGDGNLLKQYLDVQARFDRYSVGNALLIAAQMPEATRLADFDTWKQEGIFVKKGATGITVLEPGNEYERSDGSVGVSYNPKKVFDISQTNARQKSSPMAARDSRLLIKALIHEAPCQFFITENLPDHVGAAYQPKEKTILVRQGMDGPMIFRSLSQELAHAHLDKGDYERGRFAFTAYCVSYILCRRNGVETKGFRFDRVSDALASMDSKTIRAELGRIRDTANAISADMNRLFEAQQQNQKNRDDGAR